jgi:L-lactate dehydrogenase complex protein LldG
VTSGAHGPAAEGAASDARDVVLARIRDALRDRPAPVPVPRDYVRTTPEDVDIVELFAERVDDYRANVIPSTPDDLAAAIAVALSTRGAHRIVVPAGVPPGWLTSADVEVVTDDPPLSHQQLDAVDGVISGCAVGIAVTGTIVLDAGEAQGRRALTLLPDYHLCIVRADQIVGGVAEALERLDPRRPLTWISGPSATSDIELKRVEGVHGPRTLDVIIVAASVDG